MTKLLIEVDEDCIRRGRVGDNLSCPVANACRKKGLNPSVTPSYVRVKVKEDMTGGEDTSEILYIPQYVTENIQYYDLTEEMTPFSFELEVPEEYIHAR